MYNDDTTKAQLLNNYFTSVFTPVSSNGIVELMQNLDPFKAAGPDGIQAYF